MEPYEGGVSAECALCGGEIYQGEAYYSITTGRPFAGTV